MTRPEFAKAIRDLSNDEKLDLLDELWDSLDNSGPLPAWHAEELDRRLASAETAADAVASWPEAKARILNSK